MVSKQRWVFQRAARLHLPRLPELLRHRAVPSELRQPLLSACAAAPHCHIRKSSKRT